MFDRRVTLYRAETDTYGNAREEVRLLLSEVLAHYDQEHEPLFTTAWQLGAGDV
jgi:hypothetical protein